MNRDIEHLLDISGPGATFVQHFLKRRKKRGLKRRIGRGDQGLWIRRQWFEQAFANQPAPGQIPYRMDVQLQDLEWRNSRRTCVILNLTKYAKKRDVVFVR